MSVLPEEKRKIGRKKTQPTKKTRKAEPRISRRGWKRVNARRRKRRRASTWMTGWEVQFEFILCTAHPCSICPLRPMPWKLSKKASSHTIAMRKVREAEPRISRRGLRPQPRPQMPFATSKAQPMIFSFICVHLRFPFFCLAKQRTAARSHAGSAAGKD
jgi:hypothetical protein